MRMSDFLTTGPKDACLILPKQRGWMVGMWLLEASTAVGKGDTNWTDGRDPAGCTEQKNVRQGSFWEKQSHWMSGFPVLSDSEQKVKGLEAKIQVSVCIWTTLEHDTVTWDRPFTRRFVLICEMEVICISQGCCEDLQKCSVSCYISERCE